MKKNSFLYWFLIMSISAIFLSGCNEAPGMASVGLSVLPENVSVTMDIPPLQEEVFGVVTPNRGVHWVVYSQQRVTWNVDHTNVAPINCTQVDIILLVNGGNTFHSVLAPNTPNDGSEDVTVPNIQTDSARIKVECKNNNFSDISDTNFSIGTPVPTPTPTPLLIPKGANVGFCHRIQWGDTMADLGYRFGLAPYLLGQVNGLLSYSPQQAFAEGYLFIPQNSSDGYGPNVYMVKPGDTLASIAQQCSLSVDTLAQANNLYPTAPLYENQYLTIPTQYLPRPIPILPPPPPPPCCPPVAIPTPSCCPPAPNPYLQPYCR